MCMSVGLRLNLLVVEDEYTLRKRQQLQSATCVENCVSSINVLFCDVSLSVSLSVL